MRNVLTAEKLKFGFYIASVKLLSNVPYYLVSTVVGVWFLVFSIICTGIIVLINLYYNLSGWRDVGFKWKLADLQAVIFFLAAVSVLGASDFLIVLVQY